MDGGAIRADAGSLAEPARPAAGRHGVGAISPSWDELERARPDDGTWAAVLDQLRFHGSGRLLYHLVAKRCIDALVAALVLVGLAPLLLVVAIAVRLDSPGPVIFRQVRIGRYGRPFVMYKFRTMWLDRRWRPPAFAGPAGPHKRPADPRVTRVGRLLRSTSIDEVPQLINVLRGEMSLVGPRPELPEIVQAYAPWQHQRHLVLPGLTGWWQINGRSTRLMHEHTELDLYYVHQQSFWLDLTIIVRTFGVVLGRIGAF